MQPALSGTPVAFVYVSDRARALDFYSETLGFALHRSDGYGDYLDMGGSLLRLMLMPDQKPHAHPVVGWSVADMEAAVTSLTGRGVAFAIYEGMGQDERGIWTSDDGSKLAFFSDPDGNALMLSQD